MTDVGVSPIGLPRRHVQSRNMMNICTKYGLSSSQVVSHFLAHLWGAYAIPVALSGVRRPSYVVCRLCPP